MSDAPAVWDRLAQAAALIGSSAEDAAEEKIAELRLRHFFRCFPNDRIKPAAVGAFLEEVLGNQPSAELIDTVLRRPRVGRLTEEQSLELERRQNSRCAVCGRFLSASARPHVDHIVPVALGGPSDPSNYQFLCARCNQGKGALLSWLMASSFFIDGGNDITARLRFCVLARAGGRCFRDGCEYSVSTSEFVVAQRVPVGRGGRYIFDNLVALCAEHGRELNAREQARATAMKSSLKYNLPPGAWRR